LRIAPPGIIQGKNNFSYLALALVLLLFATALADQLNFAFGQIIVQSALVIVVAADVWGVKSKRR